MTDEQKRHIKYWADNKISKSIIKKEMFCANTNQSMAITTQKNSKEPWIRLKSGIELIFMDPQGTRTSRIFSLILTYNLII